MSTAKKLIYVQWNKTVSIGQKMKMRWANGNEEVLEVGSFSRISNQPISTTNKMIMLEYVVDWDVS